MLSPPSPFPPRIGCQPWFTSPSSHGCRSNVLGTRFTVFDNGVNPNKKPFIPETAQIRQELGAICYVRKRKGTVEGKLAVLGGTAEGGFQIGALLRGACSTGGITS